MGGAPFIPIIEQRKATIRASEREIDEADEIVRKLHLGNEKSERGNVVIRSLTVIFFIYVQ